MRKYEELFAQRKDMYATLGYGTITPEKLYASAKKYDLLNSVPLDIRNLWEVAQNLYVHSYYANNFVPVSRLYCYFSLELALRTIVGSKTRKIPSNLGSAIKRINNVFPRIKPIQTKWLVNQNNMRGIKAHPLSREIDLHSPYMLYEHGLFINGLFCENEPRLLIPDNFLFNTSEIIGEYKNPMPNYFKYDDPNRPRVHTSKARAFILNCDRYEIAFIFIHGYLETPEIFGPNTDLCIDIPIGEEIQWKEYVNRSYKIALKIVKGQEHIENLHFYFGFIHRETWHKYRLIKNLKVLNGYSQYP